MVLLRFLVVLALIGAIGVWGLCIIVAGDNPVLGLRASHIKCFSVRSA